MEVPVLQTPQTTKIHLIGGEKGGVGKSMVSRLLAQHFIDSQQPFVGYDTDRSHGALMRFYADFASPALADRYEALDQIIESAVDQPGRRVLVDLAAQTHEPLVRWMDESGVLDMADLSGLRDVYKRQGQLERAVGLGAKVIRLRRLHDAVVQKIDARNASFWSARNVTGPEGPGLGLMERQRLKMWLTHAYGELAKAEP